MLGRVVGPYAFNQIGKSLIFSEDRMETFQEELENTVKSMGVPGRAVPRGRMPMM